MIAVDPASAPPSPKDERQPVPLHRALGAVVAATVLPGLGHLLLGRRRTGVAVLAAFLVGVGAVAVALLRLGRAGLVESLVSTRALLAVTLVCVVAALGWVAMVVWTYVLTRPRTRTVAHRVLGATVVAVLCAGVAVPLGTAARLANTQRTLLGTVFPVIHTTVPAPTPPGLALPPRLTVLLLGSDAGPDRTGARTDTVIVASIDTRTAATTLIALPRNIQHAPFPPSSPLASRFPDGFHDPRSPTSGDYLLNNVAEYGRQHPDLAPAGPTGDRGLNLLMSSISYMLALPLDHYVEVDMSGLAAIIDALGGVTVDVGPVPLPIGGVTYDGRHVKPTGYVPAGVQHLDGNQALWYARSRRNADDYARMARQRCLIDAVLTQKSAANVVTHFRSVAAATASSVSTDIPQDLLPALLTLADEHRPLPLRGIAFDPDLPDPSASRGTFNPARPDIAYMRQVVRAALAPQPASSPRPSAPSAATPAPPTAAPVASSCAPSS